MGRVVDADLKVKGVENPRIVDASIFPIAMGAHLQAPVYALSEQAAFNSRVLLMRAAGTSGLGDTEIETCVVRLGI